MVVLYVFVAFIILLFVFLYIITLFLNWNNFVISGVDEYENLENVYYIIVDKEFCKETNRKGLNINNVYYIIVDKEFCKKTNRKGLDINVYTFILFCFQNTEICRTKIIRLLFKQFVIKD